MGLTVKVPTPGDLAASYRTEDLWNSAGLRAGIEHVAQTDPRRLAIADHSESVTYEQLRLRVERVHRCDPAAWCRTRRRGYSDRPQFGVCCCGIRGASAVLSGRRGPRSPLWRR